MCLTPIVDYVPRPVKEPERPQGAPPSLAEQDSNLFGPRPTPPEWQAGDDHHATEAHTHSSSGTTTVSAAGAVATAVAGLEPSGSRLESTIVELASGRRLLITEF